MRIFSATSVFAVLIISASVTLAGPGRGPKKPKPCNPRAKGPNLEKAQQAAVAGFADLFLVKQDVKLAFDTYVPGEYIQHNPFAEQGREFAIQFLSASIAQGIETDHHTIFGGEGYGLLHYRMKSLARNTTWSVADYFRFEGTCIVEHWDVLQVVTGEETNPIAFF